jgi:hypothetical protein
MSDRESFLERWSRRKRAAPLTAEADAAAPPPANAAHPDGSETPSGKSAEVPFDISKLPPLESITAETDIRAYLAPGVPAELSRAALRRAWAADPKIRDFVGLSENAWDFNAPDGMRGFGPLQMTDELRRQIASMVGRALQTDAAEEPKPQKTESLVAHGTPDPAENSIGNAEIIAGGDSAGLTAMQQSEQAEEIIPPKRHGGALPA